jgi:RNA polymerase sigma-70 factor, ECF subfamily
MALRNVYDELPDAALIQAVLDGEPAAWPTFFAKYERLIIACIRKVLHRYHAQHNEEDLEDLISSTALNIVKDDYKKLRAFDPTRGYKLSSWIGLIATNTAHDALRRRTPVESGLGRSIDDDDTGWEPAHEGESALEALERRDRAALLRRAVEELGATDQLFVRYYFEHEMEPEDIARLMNISINTVYSRKNKVREKLKRILVDGPEPRDGAREG